MTKQTITMTTKDIEGMFLGWLRGEGGPLHLHHFQQAIAESEAKLPDEACEEFGYPEGTTVGHAVRCSLAFFNQHGDEYRLDTRLGFKTEADSLLWWRNNRDNPNRVTLTHQRGGKWAISIAPMGGPDRGDWKDGF